MWLCLLFQLLNSFSSQKKEQMRSKVIMRLGGIVALHSLIERMLLGRIDDDEDDDDTMTMMMMMMTKVVVAMMIEFVMVH